VSELQSRIEGGEAFIAKLSRFEEAVVGDKEEMIDEEIRATQREWADLVPVRTGKAREQILKEEALLKIETPSNGHIQWRLGLLTKAQLAAAYYLFWVEFGTKGYAKGDRRAGGRDKRGRRRKHKVTRAIPARPAQPSFRPAAANFIRRVVDARRWARIISGNKEKLGLN